MSNSRGAKIRLRALRRKSYFTERNQEGLHGDGRGGHAAKDVTG